ncbi:hypothetical protein NW768_000959 [Fusarium equiseti]|uniref:Clr5 domain-containing protein n=1 Tax=Fusarium equiseti TaxID=61235 RepID=A0ABQ8RUH1_FUSEQ|nr:hypothetical protein NW768_000959 [Fusarium equiseti]
MQTTPRNPPNAEDWESYRAVITELYVNQNMSLPRLRRYMQDEYQFYASPNMFKTRFREWNAWKNMTVKRILPSMDQRNSANRQIQSHRHREYLRRLPTDRLRQLLDSLNRQQPISASASLSSPQDLQTSEFYMYQLNALVKGSSDAKLWPTDEVNGFLNEDTVPAWCSSAMSAIWVLNEGNVADAYRFLQKFIEASPRHLPRQDPLVFLFVFTSVLSFAIQHKQVAMKLTYTILYGLRNLKSVPTSHPLRQLIEWMAREGPEGIVAHASKIILTYVRLIQETLGSAYPIVQDILSDAMSRLLKHNLVSVGEVISLGRDMVLEAEASRHNRGKDYFNLKLSLADAHLANGETVMARMIAREIVHSKDASPRLMVWLCMTMSRVEEKDCRHDEAIEWALRGIVKGEEIFGKCSDWHLNALVFYRQLLERLGRSEDAGRVAQDRDFAIEELCSKVNAL